MKMRKLVGGLLLGASVITLASCDFNFDNFNNMITGESSSTTESTEESSKAASSASSAASSSMIYTLSTEDGSTVTSTTEPSTAISSSAEASSESKASSSSAASSSAAESSSTSSSSAKKSSSSSTASSSASSSSSVASSSKAASSSASSSSVASSSTVEEEITITSLVDDYSDNYAYLELISDSTYGDAFKEMYIDFYDTALTALTSSENYTTTDVSGTNIILLDKYCLEEYDSSLDMAYAVSAMMTFIYDNPIFYFLRGGYVSGTSTNTSTGETIHYIYLTASEEYATAEARQAVNECIIETVEEFYQKYDSSYSDYKKAKYINDYMTDKISYAFEEDGTTAQDDCWAHNIEGFVNSTYKQGVCECYAKSYLFLSRLVGLNSLFIAGYANGNTSYGHAWNYTQIGDSWYGVDVTWNDTQSDYYMLVGSTKLNKDHTAYDSTYGITYQVELPTLSTHSYGSLLG